MFTVNQVVIHRVLLFRRPHFENKMAFWTVGGALPDSGGAPETAETAEQRKNQARVSTSAWELHTGTG